MPESNKDLEPTKEDLLEIIKYLQEQLDIERLKNKLRNSGD